MKILLLSPLPPPAGGIASWTKGYMETKEAKTNEITLINTAITGKRVNEIKKISFFDEVKRFSNIYLKLNKKLNSEVPDITHLNTSCSKLGLIKDYLLARRIKKSDSLLLVHCRVDVNYMVDNKVSKYLFKKLINKADNVLTLNSISKKEIREEYGKVNDIIPNFIRISEKNNHLILKDIKPSIKKIVYVGHLSKLKGTDLLFKLANYFKHIKFTLIGNIDEYTANMEQPKNIILLGEVSKETVNNELEKSDLFLFPTLTEGFPNALLEAMVMGLPVVTTPVGAIPDMLENKGGVLVEPGDFQGFISAINKLEHDIVTRKAMSKWNKEKVFKYYSEEKVFKELFDFYHKMIF